MKAVSATVGQGHGKPFALLQKIYGEELARAPTYKAVRLDSPPEAASPFPDLPTELCSQIFALLEAKDLLASAQLVNRSWFQYSSSDAFWSQLCYSKWGAVQKPYSLTWKEAHLDMLLEVHGRRPCRQAQCEEHKNSIPPMPLPACGMRCPPRMKPPRPEPKPVDLVDYQKAPVGGFVVHPDSSKDVTASFEAPFYDLQSLDGVFMTYRAVMRRLDSEEQTLRAIHRYYEFMQLKAKLPKGTMLVPTNDIEAVWLTHMLRPTQYLNELEQLFGLMDVEHKILLSDFELHHKQLALEDTAQLWQTAYGEAYCNLENDIHEAPPRLWHNFWCGLTVVNEWQSTYSFYNPPEIAIIEAQENSSPISSPFSQIIPSARRPGLKIKKSDASEVPEGWKNPFGFSVADVQYIIMNDHPSSLPDISTGLKAYERFLFLCAKYREKIFQEDGTPVPSFSPVPDIISALWQFHMLHPTAYAHDCQRLLGFQLNFGPAALSKNRLGGKASVVEELYLQEFGVDLRMEGMYSRHSELSLYF